MLRREDLMNAILFMKRVTCTGEECGAWAQTYVALQAEIVAVDEAAKKALAAAGDAK